MNDRNELIRIHLSNQLSLEKQILEAVESQRKEDRLRENLEANKIIIEVERVLKMHISGLERLSEEYGADASVVKKAMSEVMGLITSLFEKMRDHTVSRVLRDDYVALSLSAMGYTALHTFGLATDEKRIADVALKHLEDLTPLLVSISKVIPLVVAEEVGEETGMPVNNAVVEKAIRNTHSKWSKEIVESRR